MARHLFLAVVSLALVVGSARPLLAIGCPGPMTVLHMSGTGGFDLSGTGYAGKSAKGPAIRFWAYGNFAKANSGEQDQFASTPWLANAAVEFSKYPGINPNLWILKSADWYGDQISGCPLELSASQQRTVVEMSFADPVREGTKEHGGFYLVASIALNKDALYDADDIRGGSGPSSNMIAIAPIPAPRMLGAAKPAAAGDVEVSVELPAAVSYSEGGKDAPVKLIKGYRLLYAKGPAPTTSDPAKYTEARDAKDPTKTLGVVHPGTITAAVPAGDDVWLVAQVAYEDPSPLYSRGTSGHVRVGSAPAEGAAGAGRRRSESKKK